MTQGSMETLVVMAIGIGILNLILLKIAYMILKNKIIDEYSLRWKEIREQIKGEVRYEGVYNIYNEIHKEIELLTDYLNVEIETTEATEKTRKLVPKKKKVEIKGSTGYSSNSIQPIKRGGIKCLMNYLRKI